MTTTTTPPFHVTQTPRWFMVVETATGICWDVYDRAGPAHAAAARLASA